jgi:hypothetical protein
MATESSFPVIGIRTASGLEGIDCDRRLGYVISGMVKDSKSLDRIVKILNDFAQSVSSGCTTTFTQSGEYPMKRFDWHCTGPYRGRAYYDETDKYADELWFLAKLEIIKFSNQKP